jgi:hypothetical protein
LIFQVVTTDNKERVRSWIPCFKTGVATSREQESKKEKVKRKKGKLVICLRPAPCLRIAVAGVTGIKKEWGISGVGYQAGLGANKKAVPP